MKKILIGMIVLCCLVLGAVYYYIQNLDMAALKDRILAQLQNHINGEVQVRDVRISGFSRLALDGVEIKMDGRVAFATELAYLDLNLTDLMQQKLTLNAMGIESARLNLFRIGEKWNYEVLLPEKEAGVHQTTMPKLSMEGVLTTTKSLRIDSIRVRDLKIYDESKHLVDISMTGSLDYPWLKIREVKLNRGQRTEVLASLDVELESKSVALQFLKNLLDPRDFRDFASEAITIPAGDFSLAGTIQIIKDQIKPDFSLGYSGTSIEVEDQKLVIEPFSLGFKDKISGVIQSKLGGVQAGLTVAVSDYLAGQDKIVIDGSVLNLSVSLKEFAPEALGKVEFSSKLSGGLSSVTVQGTVQSDLLTHPVLQNALNVSGVYQAKADVLNSKAALHGLDVKVSGAQKTARISGGLGYDGAKGYPQGLLMDLNLSGFPGQWVHPALSSFTLKDASLKSGLVAAFTLEGIQSLIKGGFQIDLNQEPVFQKLGISGNMDMADLGTYMRSQNLPKVDANLKLDLKGPVTGAYLMDLSSQSVSVVVTNTLPPMVFSALKSQVQIVPKEMLVRVAASEFQIFGGKVGIQGFIKSDENKLPNSFQATIQNLDLDALVVYGAPDMHGHISGKLDGVIEDFRLIEPFSEMYPVAIKGVLSVRQPVYYYHRGVADMIDSVEEQIRQKHLANLLQKKSDEQRKTVRFSAFEDMASVPFEFTRKRLTVGPAILAEKNKEFVGSFAQMIILLPVNEAEEGQVKGDLHVQLGNAFLRTKFPWLRDDFTQDLLTSVAIQGPFSQPISPQEMQRVQQSVTSAIFQALDLSKIKSSVEQGINTIKNLFQGGSSAQPAKQQVIENVQDKVQDKVDQSLRGVEKMLGTTETEALKNKVTDKIFKLFR